MELLVNFYSVDGWGRALAATGLNAAEMAQSLADMIRSESVDPRVKLAAWKYFDERCRAVLRANQVMRTVKQREILELPEQTIDGHLVSGRRIHSTETEELIGDSLQRTEDVLRESTARLLSGIPQDVDIEPIDDLTDDGDTDD